MPQPINPKAAAYAELVAERKNCFDCPKLTNPSQHPSLDSNHIGPYSRWQGNLNAQLLVVGKDSSDIDTYLNFGGDWPGAGVDTNVRLVELMNATGFQISLPQRNVSEDRYFFTNAVLCLKPKKPGKKRSMRGEIDAVYFRNCGNRFLRRTIELVQPRAVATLGEDALNATLSAFELKRFGSFTAILDRGDVFDLPCGSRLFPMCHPNITVRNTLRPLEIQLADWQRIADWLNAA